MTFFSDCLFYIGYVAPAFLMPLAATAALISIASWILRIKLTPESIFGPSALLAYVSWPLTRVLLDTIIGRNRYALEHWNGLGGFILESTAISIYLSPSCFFIFPLIMLLILFSGPIRWKVAMYGVACTMFSNPLLYIIFY